MNRALIIDLDGTLCDNTHRLCHLEQVPKDWGEYNAQMGADKLNLWCKEIMRHFQLTHTIFIITGRMKTLQIREDTLKWLQFHKIPYDKIFFRNDQDFRDDTVVKQEIYEKYIKGNWEVTFCVDDRPRVVSMWRELGMTCLQPNHIPY